MMERKMKDSGIPWIGMIPEDWKVCRHKDIFSSSKELVGSKWNSTQLLSLTTKGIKSINPSEQTGKVPNSYETYQIVEPNNIVMCLFDLDCSAVFAGISPIKGMISPAYKVLTTFQSTHPKYIDYYFQFIFNGRKFMYLSKNIRYSLTYDEFAMIHISIPSFYEQEKIASWLDEKCGEIDELIEVEQKMIVELEAYRQALITETVTRGLNAQFKMVNCEGDWFTIIPEHWKKLPIRQIFRKRTEKNNPIKTRERLSLSIDKGITLYADKTTNLDRFKDDFTQYQIAHPNDIVLNSMNMIVGAVGKSKYHGCVSPVYYVIYPIDKNTSSNYYGYLLNIPQIRQVYHKLGKGIYAIERGEGRVNTCRLKVDYYEFGNIYVPFPPLAEQRAIADYLDTKCKEIDELIAVKREKIETLKQYRQSIIFEAVTGKISIK